MVIAQVCNYMSCILKSKVTLIRNKRFIKLPVITRNWLSSLRRKVVVSGLLNGFFYFSVSNEMA